MGKGLRFWITFLWVALLTVSLTACGSSSNEETTETTEAPPVGIVTESETEAATEPETEAASESEADPSAASVLQKDKKIDNYYYEYVMSSDGQRMAGFKLWVNGNRIRFDAEEEGQTIYLDYDLGEGYLYMPDGNVLMKMPLESLGGEWESPFLFAGEIEQNALEGMKYEGKETIDGKECYIYTGESMGSGATYYIWKDEGVIVKFVLKNSGQPTYEYYFKDLTFGQTYDSELKLPEGAEIVDMTKQP